MTDEPKLTEAQLADLAEWYYDEPDPDGHYAGIEGLRDTVARMVATSAQTARDEARRERDRILAEWTIARERMITAVRALDEARDTLRRTKAAAEALEASFRVQIRGLTEQRDEARAQVVACQTAADDLRARVAELHQPTDADECPVCTTEDGMSYASPCPTLRATRAPEGAGIAHRAANSASVDPSATPDLLGPQIGDSA